MPTPPLLSSARPISCGSKTGSALRLGSFSSIARHWIPDILSAFRLLCPDTQVSLTVNDMNEMATAVRNEELDCAMVELSAGAVPRTYVDTADGG